MSFNCNKPAIFTSAHGISMQGSSGPNLERLHITVKTKTYWLYRSASNNKVVVQSRYNERSTIRIEGDNIVEFGVSGSESKLTCQHPELRPACTKYIWHNAQIVFVQ
jgi:hypothetical protein